MPNWCFTSYKISRSKKDGGVKPLYDFLKKTVEEECKTKNDFGKTWLGDIVEKGLNADPVKGKYECRGSISDFDMYDIAYNNSEELAVYTETAWGPMNDMWFDLCKRFVPGAKIYYIAEECGNGVFCTNDPDYKGKYNIDSWNDEIESIDDANEATVREAVAKVTGKKVPDDMKINDVIKLLYEDDYDMSINPWDYEPEQPDYDEEVA